MFTLYDLPSRQANVAGQKVRTIIFHFHLCRPVTFCNLKNFNADRLKRHRPRDHPILAPIDDYQYAPVRVYTEGSGWGLPFRDGQLHAATHVFERDGNTIFQGRDGESWVNFSRNSNAEGLTAHVSLPDSSSDKSRRGLTRGKEGSGHRRVRQSKGHRTRH